MPSKSSKSSKNASYDLKAADRKRDLVVKGGLTALVIIFAVVLVAYIVMNGKPKADPHKVQAVQIAASNVVTNPGTKDPKVTLTIYEDFLCPVCGVFEKTYGPTIAKLIDNGDIAVDYNVVSIIGRGDPKSYSTRAGAIAYCVADEDKTAFRRFHEALYKNQPEETAATFPDNAKLLEYARQSGVAVGPNDPLSKCVENGVYTEMVNNMARNAQIQGTPTIKINGTETSLVPNGDPASLIEKIKAIAPDLPNLSAASAAPAAPAPGAPEPQPAPAPHQ